MNASARLRPVCRRDSFRAASIASAPLLVKKTRLGSAPGCQRGQPLGQPDLRRIVEVRPRHVDQAGRPACGSPPRPGDANARRWSRRSPPCSRGTGCRPCPRPSPPWHGGPPADKPACTTATSPDGRAPATPHFEDRAAARQSAVRHGPVESFRVLRATHRSGQESVLDHGAPNAAGTHHANRLHRRLLRAARASSPSSANLLVLSGNSAVRSNRCRAAARVSMMSEHEVRERSGLCIRRGNGVNS